MKRFHLLNALFLCCALLVTGCQKGKKTAETTQVTDSIVAESTPLTTAPDSVEGVFHLISLPYSTDALEPVISKHTIELHHGKHHRGYVKKLNMLIAGTVYEQKSLIEIVKSSKGDIFNNAGQMLNHDLYFTQFSPEGGDAPTGELGEAINRTFGSFDNFKQQFKAQAMSLFGSGWCWLACNKKGELSILAEANGSNPVVRGLMPLMGLDVWEHAYYLDYENRRDTHIDNVWKIIDWQVVARRYAER